MVKSTKAKTIRVSSSSKSSAAKTAAKPKSTRSAAVKKTAKKTAQRKTTSAAKKTVSAKKTTKKIATPVAPTTTQTRKQTKAPAPSPVRKVEEIEAKPSQFNFAWFAIMIGVVGLIATLAWWSSDHMKDSPKLKSRSAQEINAPSFSPSVQVVPNNSSRSQN